jgi:hypothetical protein
MNIKKFVQLRILQFFCDNKVLFFALSKGDNNSVLSPSTKLGEQ